MNIDKYLNQLKGGTVYLKDNLLELHHSIGYRDLANEILIDKQTSFPTASAGKFFVAVGIMKLIEQGKISLLTTLKEVLSFKLNLIDDSVTIKQLLTHTSGVPNYFPEDQMEDYSDLWKDYPNYKIRSSKDLLPLFIDKPMEFTKGDHFSYNDSGFVLLGLIIEEVTGKSFDDYLSETIFKPLGMDHTGYYVLDRLPKNCANAYIYDTFEKQYYMNIYSVDVKGTGAGGAFTNALDIKLFWDGLFNQKIISESSLKQMLIKHVTLDGFGYGLGVWLDDLNNPYFVGEDPGVTFISWYNLNKPQIITIISNYRDDVFSLYRQIKLMFLKG